MQNSNIAQIEVGQMVFSATQGDHGCREGWVAEIVNSDSKTVLAMITSNQYCSSCWQVGCVDNGQEDNDRVGEMISFNYDECSIDQYGQIIVNKLIS